MRILVVDDDDVIREILQAILAGPGREIHLAESCGRAFELVQANRYDLVTLDLNLPDGCGLDVLERIRRNKQQTRALVVSGNAHHPLYAERARTLGAEALLQKPFEPIDLRRLAFGSETGHATETKSDTARPAPLREDRDEQ